MRRNQVSRFLLLGIFLVSALHASRTSLGLQAAKKYPKYPNAQAAYGVGVGFLNNMDYPRAQESLEAALGLSPDDRLKHDVQRALLIPYRALPEMEKYLDTAEWLMRNPGSPAERSLVQRQLVSHAMTRGRVREVVDRYEKKLEKSPEDPVLLLILSSLYVDGLKEPQRGADLTARLAAITKGTTGTVDVRITAQLAQQHFKTGKYKESAELYEQAAQADRESSAWHWKEAALAWVKAGDKNRARQAAKSAAAAPPEARSKILIHFWHRALGETFLETGDFGQAADHLQKAIDATDIAGYRADCQRKLEEAKAKGKL